MKKLFCSLYYSSASIFVLSLTLASAMDAPHSHEPGKRDTPSQTATASTSSEKSSLGKRSADEAISEQEEKQSEADLPEAKRQRLDSLSLDELHAEASAGNSEAQLRLAMIYQKGELVPRDLTLTIEWLQKAADQGLSEAQYFLGQAYYNGLGMEVNLEMSVTWFKKAAKQGYAPAQFVLGYTYEHGEGVTEDLNKAIEWYKRAAAQEDADAQASLADAYEKGSGVDKDIGRAIEWYTKAANNDHPDGPSSIVGIIGKLQNVVSTSTDATHERLKALAQLVQPFVGENYLQAGLHRPGCGLGRVNNPEVANFYETIADFGREISRIIEGFNSPGFMVKFATPENIANFTSIIEERYIQRYSRLNNLVCFGKEAVEIGNLLHQMLFDEHKTHPLSFAQLQDLLGQKLNEVSHSIKQFKAEIATIDALIRSCAPASNDEEFVQKHQQDFSQVAQQYVSDEERIANLITGAQFQKQAEEIRSRMFAEYINKMIFFKRALERQQESHKLLEDQLAMISTIKSELLELLNLGVNERNNRLKELYPWLG